MLGLYCYLLLSLCILSVYGRLESFDFSLDSTIDRIAKFETPVKLGASDPFLGIKSKSGYLPVGKKGGKLFYWCIPFDQTEHPSVNRTTPVVIWFTGGPGCSSELAALTENGPLTVKPDGTVVKNPYSWHMLADIIYIDQPLGTGFSIAGDACNYVTDEHTIAEDMLLFFVELIDVLPEIKHKPFYITGESYAGHYIPAIAHTLIKYPIEGIDFVGIAIGNGWVDPILQYPSYATYGYANQLLGKVGYKLASKALEECVELIKNKQLILAVLQCNAISSSIVGKKNVYDIRLDCEVPPMCYNDTMLIHFLNKPEVQQKLGVDKPWEECDTKVHTFLLGDFDTETRSKVASIIRAGYKVLIYNGDQDYICNWMGGESWTNQVEWQKQVQFAQQEYTTWQMNGKALGEFKRVDNFMFLKVFEAGHMVPMDQPESAYNMIKEFLFSDVLGKPRVNKTVDSYPQPIIA